MPEERRCNRCGNLLPADSVDNTCPACMLRAGLEPVSEPSPKVGPAGEEITFGFEPVQPGHVPESLARSIWSVPRVLLPDTSPDDAGVAIIKPSSDEMPAPATRGVKYLLFGEIARGGMGAVLKGRDPDLGRNLAVKVLLESHEGKPELVRRACAAALAGSGKAADDPPPDEDAQTEFRAQARDWLRADLALHAKQFDAGAVMARTAVAQTLQHWKQDSDLAGIRDADRLAKLPAAEQTAWRTLWADVDSLLKPEARLKATEAKQSGR